MTPVFNYNFLKVLFSYKNHRFISLTCHNYQKNVTPATDKPDKTDKTEVPAEKSEVSTGSTVAAVEKHDPTDTSTDREKLIKKKITDIIDRYEEFTGLREVKKYQDRVVQAQDELIKIQEKRRRLNQELLQITLKRNELQSRFHTISRDDPQWYSTIGEENRLLLKERDIRNQLEVVERDERDYFTYMSNAVRDSHEKQRWQADRTKYWSLVLTVLSSFLTYIFSDWRHRRIVQELVRDRNEALVFPENVELQKLINVLSEGTARLQSISLINSVTSESIAKLDDKLTEILKSDIEVRNRLSRLTKALENSHEETVQLISQNKQQINFLGNGQENYEDINVIHGPSFGLGILCTFGILALIRIMFANH